MIPPADIEYLKQLKGKNNLIGIKSNDLPITDDFLKYSYEDEEDETNEARTNEEIFENADIERLA